MPPVPLLLALIGMTFLFGAALGFFFGYDLGAAAR